MYLEGRGGSTAGGREKKQGGMKEKRRRGTVKISITLISPTGVREIICLSAFNKASV